MARPADGCPVGVVLHRLPSLADRIRLRAVCRTWRWSAAIMLHQSPPQLPWFTFHDGTLLDVSKTTTHRLRLPDDDASCYCAGENMLFLLHGDGRCSLMNTFSSEVTPLPELAALLKAREVKSTSIDKVVVSSAPRLVAVLFRSIYGGSGVLASICRPDGKIQSCQVLEGDLYMGKICDIAIFCGKIHAITRDDHKCKLLGLELHNDEQRPRFSRRILCDSLPPTPSKGMYEVRRYLVESNSKLLVVRRWVNDIWYPQPRARELSVVEADLSSGQLNKIDGLEGQALFVSMQCSKSVPAAAAGARQDCVYFLDEYVIGDSGAHSMGDRTITPLLPEEPATPLPLNSARWCPAWFFPVEV